MCLNACVQASLSQRVDTYDSFVGSTSVTHLIINILFVSISLINGHK